MLKENNEEKARLDLALRVNEAIKSLGRGGKRRIAEKCNVSEQAITGWVKNGRIHRNNLLIVSEMSGYELQWLITGTGQKFKNISLFADNSVRETKSNAQWLGGFEIWDSNTPLREDEVALPYFREVELAAGQGRTEVIENHGNKLRFAKSTLKKQGVEVEAAACVTISGNSMEPVLPDGSTVGIDTSKKHIKDGDWYAIDHAGHLRVKVLYSMPGGKIRLRSFNSDEWPDELITPDEIRILGRVFWWSVLR